MRRHILLYNNYVKKCAKNGLIVVKRPFGINANQIRLNC